MKRTHIKSQIKNRISSTNPVIEANFDKVKTSLGILIAIFAFFLYAPSIQHYYTLDDHPVIDENIITIKGIEGIPTILKTDYWYGFRHDELRGPVYRPTSKIIFAIIWEFLPNNPHAYHFINVLFYSATCLILFLVLYMLFQKQNLLFPFICSLIYAAHPIHTEVVNNIKSLDEILCFFFGITSIWLFLKFISSRSKLTYILGGICFFLSLISKETGIAFLIIIPLTIFFFFININKPLLQISSILFILTIFWLLIRRLVFQELPPDIGILNSPINNTLNAAPDNNHKYATTFYILLRYIILLIFPHPLTCDYNYAQIKILSLSNPIALFAIITYLGLGIYTLINLKKKSIIVFGILVFLLPLAAVSNVFFLGGSSMAERFMYIPSLGFCLILTYFMIKYTGNDKRVLKSTKLKQLISTNKALFIMVFGIIFLYSFKTVSRSKYWRDDLTLFSNDVKVSKNSATANQILGSFLMTSALKSKNQQSKRDTIRLAKNYLKRSIQIYPHYYAPFSHLGVVYIIENKLDSSYYYLTKGIEMAPNDVDLNFNLGLLLFMQQKYDEAIIKLEKTISLDPDHENAYYNLAAIYTNIQDYDKGYSYFQNVIKLNPKNANAYYHSGLIMKSKGDTIRANDFMNKAINLGHPK
jgi:protein O-mannosyl-transferase